MTLFFSKLRRYGYRRAFTYVIISMLCKVKFYLYKWILSENRPLIIKSRILQATQFVGKGKIEIIEAQLGVWPSPGLINTIGYIEARCDTAKVMIGKETFINNSFVIIADRESVVIGSRCLIGPNFFACDSDFHGLEVENRSNGNYGCSHVIIKDDVFIGEGVRVLKGVSIGEGAVVGGGSLVVKDVEAYSIYAGVPAKKVRDLRRP